MFGTKLYTPRGPEDQEAQPEWAFHDPGRCACADAAHGRKASTGSPVSEQEECMLGRMAPASAQGSPCPQEL